MVLLIFRTVLQYYSGGFDEPDEDAFDMRKACSRDVEGKSVIPLKKPITVDDMEF